MSWDATAWAKQVTAGGPGPKAVLLCLADRADEEWSCFPSQQLLAAETEQSVRTVQRQLAGLEDDGLIKRIHRTREDGYGRTSDRYILLGKPSEDDNLSHDNLSRKGSLTRQIDGGLHDTAVVPTNTQEQSVIQELIDIPETKTVEDFFEEWFAIFKQEKRNAQSRAKNLAAFKVAVKKVKDPQILIDAARAKYAWYEQENTPPGYRKTSIPWLHGECWEEEVVGLRAKVATRDAYAFTEGIVREPTWI